MLCNPHVFINHLGNPGAAEPTDHRPGRKPA